jgi:hypothetical protein
LLRSQFSDRTPRLWCRDHPVIGDHEADLRWNIGAGEGNRTLMTSLEGWGSTIELRPRSGKAATP